MDKHKRQNSLVSTLWWLHMDEVNVQSCVVIDKTRMANGCIIENGCIE